MFSSSSSLGGSYEYGTSKDKGFVEALRLGAHFDEVIHVPDLNMDPDDYVQEFVEVCTGGPVNRLSSGIYARVYEGKNSSVFKVGSALDNQGYIRYFARYSKNQENPFFPKVYWSALIVNEDQESAVYIIHMEKLLETWIPKDDIWARKTYGRQPEILLEKLAENIECNSRIVLPKNVAPVPPEFYSAKKAIREAREEAELNHYGDEYAAFDLHNGNFMWRHNGQIVITDPIS